MFAFPRGPKRLRGRAEVRAYGSKCPSSRLIRHLSRKAGSVGVGFAVRGEEVRKCATLLILNVAMGIGSFHLQAQTGAPGSLVQAAPPMYPLAAKAAGIEGEVVLKGIIDTDGHMKNLQVVKGPSELRQAAVEAVMHWIYHP